MDATTDDLLRSAFWHYQYYWFNLLKEKFSSIVDIAFDNLSELLNSIDLIEYNQGFDVSADSEFYNWKEESSISLRKAKDDIFSIIDSKYQAPLEIYLKTIVKN